jgi:DNA end-binding protein Ku
MAEELEERDEALQPRGAIWSGVLTFGLVSIPVELFPAVRSAGPGLRMLDADGTPLQRRFACPKHGEVGDDALVHGVELDDGRTVVVTDEELERVEPKKSREIDLRRFVDLDELHPLYFERPYFLVASGGSTKAYRLLATVMERSGRAGIASFVMRDKEYLVAILAEHGILCAQTLRFAEEIRAPESLPEPRAKGNAKATTAWERAIASLSKPELGSEVREDAHAAALRELAEKKERAGDVVESPAADRDQEGGELIDLVEVLKRKLRGKAAQKPAAPGHERRGSGKRRQSKS